MIGKELEETVKRRIEEAKERESKINSISQNRMGKRVFVRKERNTREKKRIHQKNPSCGQKIERIKRLIHARKHSALLKKQLL